MQEQIRASQEVIEKIKQIDEALDAAVIHGDDEHLFIASYLQGHFAVIARLLEMNANATLSTLDENMRTSFSSAFGNQELDNEDQVKVITLWEELLGA